MQTGEIPPEIVRFISAHVDTVPQLEALLLLWESFPREWAVEEIAARVYVNKATASRITGDLHRRGLIDITEQRLRFAAESAAAPLVTQLAQTYRKHLIQVTELIHAKGSPAMQEFARAFQFKNER